jgi:xylan 1,4-beta-xylosidase
MNKHLLAALFLAASCTRLLAAAPAGKTVDPEHRFATYANPMDLPYRYQGPASPGLPPAKVPYREAADPSIVWFKGLYWLFPSHSKGYWYSADMQHWSFVEASGYDVDKYAPTTVVIGDKMYLATSERVNKIWVADDLMSGHWSVAATISTGYYDPDLFLDDDGRLYMYDGLSPNHPLHAYELDPKTFQVLGQVDIPASRNKDSRGWEVPGDHNEKLASPSFVEGSWLSKYNGHYYLEYSAPGTEFRTYANGMLVADKPMGPFIYQLYSPFAVKPTGFITGAGHGSTFRATDGRWWHVATMTISQRHIFERRLGLFPTNFSRTGEIAVDTYLADYPHYFGGDRGLTGWMLLSRHKPVAVSSTLEGFPAENAVDEDVRTWWSAATGNADEWFQVDLGAKKEIEAVQINFADQDSQGFGISRDVYNYVLAVSDDGKAWHTVIDHSREGSDAPHDYEVLPTPVRARFVRLRNVHSPDSGKFSLYDLRVFGNGDGPKPAKVGAPRVQRDPTDGRKATIGWNAAKGADLFIVRFGVRPDLMNQNYQVYDGKTSVTAASLNLGAGYCFTVDAVNETGINQGDRVTCIE